MHTLRHEPRRICKENRRDPILLFFRRVATVAALFTDFTEAVKLNHSRSLCFGMPRISTIVKSGSNAIALKTGTCWLNLRAHFFGLEASALLTPIPLAALQSNFTSQKHHALYALLHLQVASRFNVTNCSSICNHAIQIPELHKAVNCSGFLVEPL